jgi:hypothetical protein
MLSPDKEKNEKPLAQFYANGFMASFPTPYLYIKGNAHIKSINIFTLAKYSRILVRYARLDVGILALKACRFSTSNPRCSA